MVERYYKAGLKLLLFLFILGCWELNPGLPHAKYALSVATTLAQVVTLKDKSTNSSSLSVKTGSSETTLLCEILLHTL